MNTRQQILDLITQLYITGVPDNVSAADIRQGLTALVDRQYLPSEIPVEKSGYASTNLDAILTEIIANIASVGGTMTAADIKAALETLVDGAQLSGTKVNYSGSTSVSGKIQELLGRLSIIWNQTTVYQIGEIVISDGIFYKSEKADNVNHEPPDETYWTAIATNMTGAQIAAALNTLTVLNEMVSANRVKLNDSQTVLMKFTEIDEILAAKQSSIGKIRITYSATPDKVLNVSGITTPIIQMAINRVPYQGIEADDFTGGASSYDFIYKFTTADGPKVQIMLHPSLEMNFEPNDLIDLIY